MYVAVDFEITARGLRPRDDNRSTTPDSTQAAGLVGVF